MSTYNLLRASLLLTKASSTDVVWLSPRVHCLTDTVITEVLHACSGQSWMTSGLTPGEHRLPSAKGSSSLLFCFFLDKRCRELGERCFTSTSSSVLSRPSELMLSLFSVKRVTKPISSYDCWVEWCTCVMPALGRKVQEGWEFRSTLSHVVKLPIKQSETKPWSTLRLFKNKRH